MSAIDYIICECTPCRDCDGQGEHFYRNVTGYTKGGLPVDREYAVSCETCKGSGKDAEDCGVHGAQPEPRIYSRELQAFDPKYGITGEQLGIAPAICDACKAGDHELAIALQPCDCPHHAQRRAA